MDKLKGLNVKYTSTQTLTSYANNPRTHSPAQIKQISKSINEFGFTNPILVDKNNQIIAGHGRLQAALSLGLEEVPVISLEKMTELQKKAYILADNKLAENAGWDEALLKLELGSLIELDADFDLTLTGFEIGEIDFLLDDVTEASESPIPDIPERSVTQLGDMWQLGDHRIICGDALDGSVFAKLLGNEQANLVFTDPPYNVPISGHVCGNGKVQHQEFAMASGEMSEGEFTSFLVKIISNLKAYSTDGSLHYLCMDWRHMQELLSAGKSYSELKNLCIWNKTTGGMGSLYRSQHELIFLFKNGTAKHINNVNLGKHGRNRTNVWDYPGVNSFKNKDKNKELAMHPTVKPVRMIADAIKDCSNRKDIVLDCFGGSGSTLIAAHETGRAARLIEIDPKYVDVTIMRYQDYTGDLARHTGTGMTFEEIKKNS